METVTTVRGSAGIPARGPTSTVGSAAIAPSTSAPATGADWVDVTGNLVGTASECGTVSLVSARPDRGTVIAGIAGQGLWAAQAGASTWVPMGTGPGSAKVQNRASSIVYDPTDAGRFWETGSYGVGVFATRDDGATFQPLGSAEPSDLVSVDLTDPQRKTLLAGAHEQPKVWLSTDSGGAWKDVSQGLPAGIGNASFPYMVDAATYLIGTRDGRSSGVFRSTDGGITWTVVHGGGVSGAPVVSAADGTITWLLERGDGVITSRDRGATWTDVNASGPVGNAASSGLTLLPGGRMAALGVQQVLVSDDGGAHWRGIGPSLPFVPVGMTYSPSLHQVYIWHFDCDTSAKTIPVSARSILRLGVDLEKA
jgi:hypothetical protein